MLKKYILAAAALFLLVPCIASAQEDPNNKYKGQFEVKKEVKDYNYETMSGTLSIESFLKGELAATRKPLDIVLVLDASGSMNDTYPNGPVEYIPHSSPDHGTYDGWAAEDFGFGNFLTTTSGDWDSKYYILYKGQYYLVSYENHYSGVNHIAAYFEKDGEKYYLSNSNDTNDLEDDEITIGSPKEYLQSFGTCIFRRTLYTASNPKIAALKAAVKSFIDIIAQDDLDQTSIEHKISIVKFASQNYSNGNSSIGGYTLNTGNNRNACEVVTGFTQTTKKKNALSSEIVKNTADLNNGVDAIVASGATSADFGMNLAYHLINDSKTGVRDDSDKVVILFTDGEPNHWSGFDPNVANQTISIAKSLKTASSESKRARVYTIGLFGGKITSSQMVNIDKYMNGVSSNYPNASAYTNLGNGGNMGFYQNATELDLSTVFSNIAEDIKNMSSLDTHTLVKDVMNPLFTLPSGVVTGNIKLYTAPFTSVSGTDYQFGTPAEITGDDKADYNVSMSDGDNPSLEVSGFDYKENWCGDNGGTPHGKKLIIEMPFNLKPTVALMDSTSVSTSKNDSGVYSEYGSYLVKSFGSKIKFKSLTIHMAGLHEGESAILELEKKTGTSSSVMVNRIVLTGVDNKGTEVTHRIPFLDPEATYTVTAETGWSWTYTPKSDTVQTKVLSNETDTDLHLYFKNESISQERIPRKAESILRLK